ncbi:unnamed protein product [Schistosoma mattheei]|uniref:Uncharacterized protein n=1 Tax=Schistosoma mattheei TaxID=31246 RepID=A0A183Q779_9TREM|nr:unnamed protein product [Schistosoma mattheei]
MNIIQSYAPTNDTNDDIKDQFYERLQSIIEKCSRNDLTILMGDLNAKVGTDNTGYEDIMGRHALTRREERKWRKVCKSVCIQQTGHRRNNIFTQAYTQGYMDLTEPHYREPDRSYLHQQKVPKDNGRCENHRGANIASDHHLVVANLKLKLKKNWTRRTRRQQLTATRAKKVQAQAEYTEANKQVKKSIRADKQKYVVELATTAEKATREGNMKQRYDTTKKLSGKYSKPERPVKDKEGKPITEIQQQRNRWVQYFEELLNRPAQMNPPDIEAAHTDLPIDVNPSTMEEIRMAVRQIKNEKAAGPDNIPAEALRSDIEVTTNMLHLLFKNIWEEEQVPMDCKEGHLVKILKKDLSKCENYRAFDSVDRRTLWKLQHYGVPEKIVNIIRNLYDGLQCKVVRRGQLTDAFQVSTRVRQGCLLSPFIFLLVVD